MLATCFAVGWLFARLGVAIALRKYRRVGADSPWVERARLAYPARMLARQTLVVIPPALGVTAAFQIEPMTGLSQWQLGVSAGLAGMLGVYLVSDRLERALVGRVPARRGVTLQALISMPLLTIFGLMLFFIPTRWGWPAAGVVGLGLALVTFHSAAGSVGVLRRLGLAHPASPRLSAAVERAVVSVGVKPRSVLELDSPSTNAVAWPLPRLIVFTRPAVAALDDDGLTAVAAHELGHLCEPKAVFFARLVGAYLLVGVAAGIPLAGSYGLGAGIVPVAILFVGIFGLRAVYRRMEERSDRLARNQEEGGTAEGAYARALATLYEMNLFPAVTAEKRPVHPHLYDRLTAAGAPPDYPRPEPPPSDRVSLLPLIVLLMACYVALLISLNPYKHTDPPLKHCQGQVSSDGGEDVAPEGTPR